MSSFSDFLVPGQPATLMLAACALSTGAVIGGLVAWFCPRKSSARDKLWKAFGYGGVWGVAVSLFVLVMVVKLDRTLPPLELASGVILAFLFAGLAGAAAQMVTSRITSRPRPVRPTPLPAFPPMSSSPNRPRRRPEDLGIPAISTRRR